MNHYSWLIRREFWENRAIWVVPSVIVVALTLGALFGKVDIEGLTSPDETRAIGGFVLFGFGIVFFAAMNLYSTWYLLDCLHADRKDRSILFWKSLPVSDTQTVLAKLLTAVVAIPLVYFVAADIATLAMAFIVSLRTRSMFGSLLWKPDLWLQLQALWLYLIVTTAIWYLPFIGYLMVISAWARRAVALWSIVPPLALYVLERWFFGTHVIGTLLQDRAFGYMSVAFNAPVMGNGRLTNPESVWRLLDPVDFVTSPATWLGLVVGIAFIIAAIQLRLRRPEW